MASSDRRRPQAVIGSAYSQSLLCGALEANSLALSISELAPSQVAFKLRVTLGSFHDRWRWASGSLGQGRALNELHVSQADSTTVSTPTLQATSIRSCKSRVFAAEAKKAEIIIIIIINKLWIIDLNLTGDGTREIRVDIYD